MAPVLPLRDLSLLAGNCLNINLGATVTRSLALLLRLAWKKHAYRPGWCDLAPLVCFLPLACGSVRMVAWWLLVLAPLATANAADAPSTALTTNYSRPSAASAVRSR